MHYIFILLFDIYIVLSILTVTICIIVGQCVRGQKTRHDDDRWETFEGYFIGNQ